MTRILLVEAEPALARRITWILETEGFETTVAASTDDLAGLTPGGFDAVIVDCDHDTPKKRWLIERIRETAPAAAIVDVHSAAMTQVPHAERSGADVYIHKPFDAATLLETLADLINRNAEMHTPARDPRTSEDDG